MSVRNEYLAAGVLVDLFAAVESLDLERCQSLGVVRQDSLHIAAGTCAAAAIEPHESNMPDVPPVRHDSGLFCSCRISELQLPDHTLGEKP